MLLYLIIIFSLYFIFLLLCLFGWSRISNRSGSIGLSANEFVTVIVPFRNEEKVLSILLDSLCAQYFDKSRWEVIFVNDHSSDNSEEIILRWIETNSAIQSRCIAARGEGKKNAITEGIQSAKGEIIVTTDADCELPACWISAMVNSFSDETMMVTGAVKIKASGGLFSSLQSLEFASLLGSGLALLQLGYPIFCNGASLAYRRKAFFEANGYEDNRHIASGDDEFLLRKIEAKFPKSISIVNSFDATVATNAQETVTDFIHQRIRWAGKWKVNESLFTRLLALFILLFQVSFLLCLFFIFHPLVGKPILVLCILKSLGEGIFLFRVSNSLKQSFSLVAFILLQVIYPLYVTGIGIVSQVFTSIWKDRKITLVR